MRTLTALKANINAKLNVTGVSIIRYETDISQKLQRAFKPTQAQYCVQDSDCFFVNALPSDCTASKYLYSRRVNGEAKALILERARELDSYNMGKKLEISASCGLTIQMCTPPLFDSGTPHCSNNVCKFN